MSKDEKDLGVCIIDIGGGTTDIAIFKDGQILTTKVIPIGGDHVTKDIAHELKTPIESAEALKIEHACTLSHLNGTGELIEVPSVGDRAPRNTDIKILSAVVEQRYRELFEVVLEEIGKMNTDNLRAGIVLTGGTSLLAGAVELAEEVFSSDVRLGYPKPMSGAFETINSPENATGTGLLLYALKKFESNPEELIKQKSSGSLIEKTREWFKANL